MAYGVQLFDSKGNELVGRFVPTFIADYITSPKSGSKSYPPLEGKTLKAYPQSFFGFGEPFGTPPGNATVSGGVVTWSNISEDVPLLVVYE